MDHPQHHFEIPRLGALARHAVPHIVEATLIPLGIFYLSLWQIGTEGAICTAVAWGYLAVLRRVVLRQRIPGILLLSTLGLTARTVLALSAHSTFIYFLQPCLAAGAILLLLSRPTATYVAAKAGFSAVVTGSGILVSAWWFKRNLRRQPAPAPAPGPLGVALELQAAG